MNVAVEQGKIRLYSPVPESESLIVDVFDRLLDAQLDLEAHRADLPKVDLRPAEERLAATEDELRDLFSETVSIEQAETLVARLSGAIVQAKVHAGRFNREVGD